MIIIRPFDIKEIDEITNIYTQSLNEDYMGIAEVEEGISEKPEVLGKDAFAIFKGYLKNRTDHIES